MGWTVLYIAFGVVALWLLGEVLLQYKARLRWRLLAFTGFLCVVAGALLPSVLVIGIGIVAFATGQTFVTLSYRRGFAAGWALSGLPGMRRRRDEDEAEMEPELPAFDEAPEPAPAPKPKPTPAPAPAMAGQNGFGSDTFAMSSIGANGYGPDSFETTSFDTGTFEPSGFGANGNGNGNGLSAAETFNSMGSMGYDQGGGFDTGQYPSVGGNGFGVQDTGQQQPVPVYQPGPMPGETGEFSVVGGYDTSGFSAGGQRGIYPDQTEQYSAYSDPYYGYDGNGGYNGASFDGYDPSYGSGYGGVGEVPGYSAQQSPYGAGATDGYGTNGYGTNGYGADGYSTNGYGTDGYETNGYGADGYSTNGYGTNGYETNGYGTNGYGADGYSTNGYGTNGYGTNGFAGNGNGGYGADTYGTDGYGADYGSPYGMGGGYAGEQPYVPQVPTGGGGAWVPQQRDPNDPMQGEQQPYPYQNGDPYGYGTAGYGYGASGNGYY
jgi:hypothetical protein